MPASRKVTIAQLENLVGWMEAHPLQANPKLVQTAQAKRSCSKTWEQLASRLNAMEGVSKTPKEWRQYWNDQKCRVRRKWTMLQQGGGTSGRQLWDLTGDPAMKPIEDRIVNITSKNDSGNTNVQVKYVEISLDGSSPPQPLPVWVLPPSRVVAPECEEQSCITPPTPPTPAVAELPANPLANTPSSSANSPTPPRQFEVENRHESWCVKEESQHIEESRAWRQEQIDEDRAWRRERLEEDRAWRRERLEEDRAWRREQMEENRAWRRDLLSSLNRLADLVSRRPPPP